MGDVMGRRLVDKRGVRTAGDEIVMTASLSAGIETLPAKSMLISRGTMSCILDAVMERYGPLDGTGSLRHAMGIVGDGC